MQFLQINIGFSLLLIIQILDIGNALELPDNFTAQETQALDKVNSNCLEKIKKWIKYTTFLKRFRG